MAPLSVFEAMRGHFDTARAYLVRQREIMQDLGLSYWFWTNALANWDVELLAGDPSSAERAVRRSFDATSALMEDQAVGFASRIAYALCAQGRYREALLYADMNKDEGGPWVRDRILWRCASAISSAGLGDLERGLNLSREAVMLAEDTDALNLQGDALMDLAMVSSMAGEQREATAAIEAALARYEEKGNLVSKARARSALREAMKAGE
jgi:tetratricopeptide (TPR) repeat protein